MKIAVVTFESGFLARSYVEETSLTWPIGQADRPTVESLLRKIPSA